MAEDITCATYMLDLSDVSAHSDPSLDLPVILFWNASSHVVATVPLEPPAWVLLVYPSVLTPHREGLTCIDAEVIELGIVLIAVFLLELRFCKPLFGKLFRTIAHVHSAKDSKREHLFGREVRLETRIKVLSCRLAERVAIPLLHFVVYNNSFLHI